MTNVYQVEELDIPEDKCNVDKNYDFHGCVRRSLSQKVEKDDDVGWKFWFHPGGVQDQVGCVERDGYGSDPLMDSFEKVWFDERAHFLEHLFSSLFLKFNMGDRLYGPIDMAKKAVKLGKMTMRNKVHNHTLPTDSWDLHEFFKGSDNKGILQNSWLSKKPMSILSLFCC